nr:replication initiation protein [Microvirus sp.]
MSCTNPNAVEFRLDHDTGLVRSLFLGPAVRYNVSEFGCSDDIVTRGWYRTLVPCGKCPSCLSDRARDWSNRCLMELQSSGRAIFVTLTYNDSHLPYDSDGPTLRVRDVQLFFKRLRKAFPALPIRYLLSGEYGSKTFRPHYHAIIFGLSLSDFPDIRPIRYNKLGQPLFASALLERIWSNGLCSIGSVTKKSCDYVCRYVLKKQSDIAADGSYPAKIKPPFIVSSRRPGIGLQDCEKYLDNPDAHVVVDGKDGQIYDFPVPKAVWRSLKARNLGLDIIAFMKYNNSIRSKERLETLLRDYDLPYPEILNRLAAAKLQSLKLLPERS